MKNLAVFFVSGALILASGAASAASPTSPGTTGYCYDPQGRQVACAPRFEGRSQAGGEGIDPLWAGAGLLAAGGGLAGGIAAATSSSGNTGQDGAFLAILLSVSP